MTKNIISFCFLIGVCFNAQATDSTTVVYDSAHIEAREFDPTMMEEHKADDDFDYGFRTKAELTLWERFKLWLNKILSEIFYYGSSTPIGKIIVYLICGAVVAYALYKLSMIQARKTFYGESKSGLDYELHHEDIHKLDFDKLIDEAIANKNYRLAIRLIYLLALKHLSDKQLIDWQPGKTNYDYSNELQAAELKPGFNTLSFYFDYAWYGDFEVTQSLFDKVNTTFKQWRKAAEN